MLRIAHLTDPHLRHHLPGNASISLRRSIGGLDRLRQALKQVRQAQADIVVITGDLVDVPMFLVEGMPRGFASPQNERDWHSLVLKDYQEIKTALQETGIPWIVLPGNHDHVEAFNNVFPPPAPLLCKGHRFITFYDYEKFDSTPRRFGDSQFLFKQVLSDSDSTPQIHLQHYLMHKIREGGYPLTYSEADYLRQTIANSGKVRLSLSGHHHAGDSGRVESGTHYHITPALSEFPFHWRLFELDEQEIRHSDHALESTPTFQPAVFLDRDGVINDEASYYWGPERFRLLPGVAQAIRRLNQHGIPVVVATSQSCIGMGYVNEIVVHAVHEQMHALLATYGAQVDAVYYSSGAGDASVLPEYAAKDTRKSSLLLKAGQDLHLDLARSWLIGDRLSDMVAAREAGAKGLLVHTGDGRNHQPQVEQEFPGLPQASNLSTAVEWLLNQRTV